MAQARLVGINHVALEVGDIQFTKAPEVLEGMGLSGLEKTEAARQELAENGLAGS